eukprot:11225366-Lingulodinium_polyedra.AAC.1
MKGNAMNWGQPPGVVAAQQVEWQQQLSGQHNGTPYCPRGTRGVLTMMLLELDSLFGACI